MPPVGVLCVVLVVVFAVLVVYCVVEGKLELTPSVLVLECVIFDVVVIVEAWEYCVERCGVDTTGEI